jgi:site-specific DNA-methyltransferase (adenine-specific)
MKDIPDGSVDMILCDLPYGTTACAWDSVIPFEPLWEQYKRVIKPNAAIVLTASQPFTTALISSNYKMFKYEWIWEKTKASNFVHSNYQPLKAHENICVFSFGGSAQGSKMPMTYNKQYEDGEPYNRGFTIGGKKILNGGLCGVEITNESGKRTPRSVLKISNPSGKGHLHPTAKPIALMEYLIKTYTNEGETVLDNTMGSGTTGVACVNTNRNFIGIEMDDKYFDIAKNRILETKTPTLPELPDGFEYE